MIRLLKRLFYRLAFCSRGKHAWGKAYERYIGGNNGVRIKGCRNCLVTSPVRTRKPKEPK